MIITPCLAGPSKRLRLEGRFDAHGAGIVQKEMDSLAIHPGDKLILDLAGVPYLSSAGLRVLLLARRRCENHRATLVLSALQPYCLEVLRVGGLEQSFQFEKASTENAFSSNGGTFAIHPGSAVPGGVEVLGHIEDVLASRITSGHVRSKRFSSKEFSIGLGGMGVDTADVLPLLGEMITIGGTMVWLPTDGNDTPDYMVPKADSDTVTIRTGFNVSIAGPFNEYLEFQSHRAEGTNLQDIYRAIFDEARRRRKDFKGCVALAMRAEFSEVYGAGVVKSPISDFAPANGEWITHPSNFKAWFEFDETPRHGALSGLVCGLGLDTTADLSAYDPAFLGATFYINPANAASATEMLHNHGVFFTPLPFPDPARSLEVEIGDLVDHGDFLDMRHLLDRTKVTRALIGVVYVQDFRPDPAAGHPMDRQP